MPPAGSKFKHLIRMMTILEDRVKQCSRCGMCQAVCPLYAVTGRETDVARGKLALLDGITRKILEDPGGVSQRIHHCLLCGACQAGCPRSVPVLEIFLAARSVLATYPGLSGIQKIFFRRILARPDVFDRVMAWAAKIQDLFVTPSDKKAAAGPRRVFSPVSPRQMLALAPVPFHQMDLPHHFGSGHRGPRVVFFVGCLLDKFFPHVAKAIVQVLAYHGVEVMVPKHQGCCGIPMLAGGDMKAFQQVTGHHVHMLGGMDADYLVSGCATCTAVIKKIWPAFAQAKTSWETAALTRVSQKTYDISAFLVHILGAGPEGEHMGPDGSKPIITYHDPCHLRKTLGIHYEPRRLIRASRHYHFREMPESDSCCGMGGSFNISYYATSKKIGLDKMAHIQASGAQVVATACPACMIQLMDMAAQSHSPVIVKHVMEIYSENIPRDKLF